MKALEDRLRDAYRAAAGTVDPATVPGLAVSTRPRAALSRPAGVLVPLAAAAAVTLVAIMTTLPAGMSARHHTPAAQPRVGAAASAKPHGGASSTASAATAAGLPPFVVVNQDSSLRVFNTRTGAAVGRLSAPGGLAFGGVASGGTSQTFLTYANPASTSGPCHAYYYRFQLAATGKPSALTPLRSIPGSAATAIAASPGGGTYTYSAVHCGTAPPNGLIGISGQAGNRTWAYDEGDDYTFSLAATADAGTLALSLYVNSGWANLALNTHSSAATVDGASRVVPTFNYGQSLAISPDGATLYACVSNGPMGELDAYSATTGDLIRVLHRWTLNADPGGTFFCQVSADATGKMLLASYSSDATPHTTLIAINPQAATAVKLPVKTNYLSDGVDAAW